MTIKRHLALLLTIAIAACAPGPERVVERRVTETTAPRGAALLRTAMLTGHTDARAAVGLPPLTWDDGLAADALAYAQVLARTGKFEHSVQPMGPGHEGENLFTGTRGAYRYPEMIGYWVAEQKNFTNVAVPASSRTGKFGDVGHYSQIVWRGTQRVGCALASNATDDYLVCRYSPTGNVFGYKAY